MFCVFFCLNILRYYVKNYFNLLFLKFKLIQTLKKMPLPKTKSKLTFYLPEPIINLKNDNMKPVTVTVTVVNSFLSRYGTVQMVTL